MIELTILKGVEGGMVKKEVEKNSWIDFVRDFA